MALAVPFSQITPSKPAHWRRHAAVLAVASLLHAMPWWLWPHPTPVDHKAPEHTLQATLLPSPPSPLRAEPKQVPLASQAAPRPSSRQVPRDNTPSERPVPPSDAPVADLTPPLPSPAVAPVAAATVPTPTVAPPEPPPGPRPSRTLTTGIAYLRPPAPEYPQTARRRGDEGKVVVRVWVDEFGRPEKTEVESSSGFPTLDQAGMNAVRKALFKPYTENGQAIPVQALIPLTFKLNT